MGVSHPLASERRQCPLRSPTSDRTLRSLRGRRLPERPPPGRNSSQEPTTGPSSPLPIWVISDGFTRSLNPAYCKLMRDRMGTDTWHHASGFSASWTAATCHPRPAGTAAGTTASCVGTVASPARCSRVSRTWVQRPVLHRQAVPSPNAHSIRTGELSAAASLPSPAADATATTVTCSTRASGTRTS